MPVRRPRPPAPPHRTGTHDRRPVERFRPAPAPVASCPARIAASAAAYPDQARSSSTTPMKSLTASQKSAGFPYISSSSGTVWLFANRRPPSAGRM